MGMSSLPINTAQIDIDDYTSPSFFLASGLQYKQLRRRLMHVEKNVHPIWQTISLEQCLYCKVTPAY